MFTPSSNLLLIMVRRIVPVELVLLTLAAVCGHATADTFGTDPNNTFEIEFVTIGNPGNAADNSGAPNPAGEVDYIYRMGQFAVSEDMIDKANTLGGLGITKDTRGPNKPATNIDWFEAAQFVNWLNTSTGNTPAYNFDPNGSFQLWDPNDTGYNPNNLYRNSLAKYVLPSVHEWYKAAYYDPNRRRLLRLLDGQQRGTDGGCQWYHRRAQPYTDQRFSHRPRRHHARGRSEPLRNNGPERQLFRNGKRQTLIW